MQVNNYFINLCVLKKRTSYAFAVACMYFICTFPSMGDCVSIALSRLAAERGDLL